MWLHAPAGDAFTRRPEDGALPHVLEADGHQGAAALDASGRARELEDAPGVPQQAWVRVARGVPPAEPFTPGQLCRLP